VRPLVLLALLAGIPAAVAAQSSQFGVRGLGLPGREQSARAMGNAGAFSFFDPGSSVSPASIAYLGSLTATFTVLGDYRSSTDPAGGSSIRDPRLACSHSVCTCSCSTACPSSAFIIASSNWRKYSR